MAVCAGNDNSSAEMKLEDSNTPVHLSDFVRHHSLPQCVCVTEGSFLSRQVQVSCGDVLLLQSCHKGQVTMSYRNDNTSAWTEISISFIDYPGKFKVLPPRDTSDDDRATSVIMYPTIADLLLDCPTYFEATASYDDPYLPGVSLKAGDRFWFVRIVQSHKDGVTRLKVRDHLDNVIILSSDCRGNFCALKDDNVYTIKELVDQAPVQRRLTMVASFESSQAESEHAQELAHNDSSKINECTCQSDCLTPMGSISTHSEHTFIDTVDSQSLVLSGVIHMLKPESTVSVSPYNDLDTTWTIPVSANLKVRLFYQDDYEVPAPRRHHSQYHTHIPLPLSPKYEVPKFSAPDVPPVPQPLIPMELSSFVSVYGSSLPVKAKVLDTIRAHSFYHNLLNNIEEIIIYRLDEVKRLYVKDTKSDTVYSLSHDLKLSFIEYPDKFRTISELLHLPNGSEVTVLEDISADFPKPFSLRFGDIIRLTSKTTYLIKTTLHHGDCKVVKCERIDPESGDNVKLRLPLDLEVSMVLTSNPSSRTLIRLQDLLSGAVPLPIQNVASIPEDAESQDISELPADLQILMVIPETCVVVAPSSSPQTFTSQTSDPSNRETAAMHSLNNEPTLLANVGLPLTSGILLALTERLHLSLLDLQASGADYIRIPVAKMTIAEFEELKQHQKVNPDYEDMGSGSSSTTDESTSERKITLLAGLNGLLEKKLKSTKMDKVRRLSRVLNPKHWHINKSEPEPLPHPSTMGLASLGSRLKEDTANEYQEDNVDSMSVNSGSTRSGSTAPDGSDEVEDENFYEDMEICLVKSSPLPTDTSRQTGAFSGPTHRSLPLPLNSQNKFARCSQTQVPDKLDSFCQNTIADEDMGNPSTPKTNGNKEGVGETIKIDVPKPFIRAKIWVTNLGNNLAGRHSLRPREDSVKNSPVNHSSQKGTRDEALSTTNVVMTAAPRDLKPPDSKTPLPPQEADNKTQTTDDKKMVKSPPIPQARQRNIKPSEPAMITKNYLSQNEDSEFAHQHIVLNSINLNDSIAPSKNDIELPKPKPRGLKRNMSIEKDKPMPASPQCISRKSLPTTEDLLKSVETISLHSNSSSGSLDASLFLPAPDNCRPKPLPKPRVPTHTTV